MKKLISVILAIAMVFSLCSCHIAVKEIINQTKASSSKDIKDDEENISLTVPGDWKIDSTLNEEAILGACNEVKEQYAMVISVDKVDFSNDFDLQQYANLVKKYMSKNIKDAEWSNVTNHRINNNHTIYMEVKGEVEKIKVQYFINFIENNNTYYQVIGWTLMSKVDKNRDIIKNVIDSFKTL